MQYMPGCLLGECCGQLTDLQKIRTGKDLANVMYALFQITAPLCGSLWRMQSKGPHIYNDDSCIQYRTPRYPIRNPPGYLPRYTLSSHLSSTVTLGMEYVCIGPINDITFLDYPRQLAPHLCGPFGTAREWMAAFAFLGKPPTRVGDNLELWPFEKALEVYDVVAQFYHRSKSSFPSFSEEAETFHLAHGDLSSHNILIDPTTGAITGVIDWEMAGFRPAWLAAVGGGWFNDDAERFLVTDDQDTRGNYAGETPGDLRARARFRLALAELDEDLFRHHLQGVELRALFYNCCNTYAGNTEIWLEKYMGNEWSVNQRGPFPFDFWAWINAGFDLQTRFVIQIHLVSPHSAISTSLE